MPDNADYDPDFDAVRAAHAERHGLAIAYIKKRVGMGTEYANEVASAVLSEQGGYFQLAEMPEEFAGALGTGVTHRWVAPGEALTLLSQLEKFAAGVIAGTQGIRAASLYALYAGGSLRECRSVFVLDQKPGEIPFSQGCWQPGILPRFLKLRLDCGDLPAPPALGFAPGVSFLLAPQHRDDGHAVLATLTRTPGTQDLSTPKASAMMH